MGCSSTRERSGDSGAEALSIFLPPRLSAARRYKRQVAEWCSPVIAISDQDSIGELRASCEVHEVEYPDS
jgi:hypothetical protein